MGPLREAARDRDWQGVSFQDFDDSIRAFVKALELAGVALPTDPDSSIVDLFKR
jgi:hypothetical protein